MAILEHEVIKSTSGFAKEIEESALTMIFDNLQKSQYHKPIESTVREIACNALDAIKERDAVRKILEGKKKEEDYFIRRDDDLYKDSNFDPSYYDLKWLSKEKDVIITYNSFGTTEGQDFISIKDHGVGLGGKRLEGYMKLGYSTKRNSKLTIGKFGIGAKAPLSTNVDSYRLITTYNGRKFIFDIYSHKVDSAIPKLNTKTGKMNKGYKFANGYIAYYENTTEKNSSEVIINTKKHHKSQYLDAVKSQLLYLKDIKLFVNSDGYSNEQVVTSEILYEDDKIILADNYQYSKPHIVIDGVTYGYIDFLELELESKVGNVGIKVSPEEVSVTASRETVVWNEQTRATVVKRFSEVVDIAANFVEAELKEKDFTKWIKKCADTLSHTDGRGVLGRLSKLIDKSQIKPAFPGDKTIKYNGIEKFFKGFRIRTIIKNWDSKKRMDRVQRVDATSWNNVNFEHFYIQNEKTAHRKDLYLYSIANPINDYSNAITFVLEPLKLSEDTSLTKKQQESYYVYQKKILVHLDKSNVTTYENVEIPEDWKAKLDDMTNAEDVGDAYSSPAMTPTERRAANKATVYKKPYLSNSWAGSEVKLSIEEWTLKSVASIDLDPNINRLIYATADDRVLVEFLYGFLHSSSFKSSVEIISISKENIKLYKDLKKSIYIKDVFKQIDTKNKLITVDSILIAYNTARLINKGFKELTFMYNYDSIDSEVSEKFKEVDKFQRNNRYHNASSIQDDVDSFLDKLVEFQLFVSEVDGNKKMISKKSQELFGTNEFNNSVVIDMEIYEKYKELLSYAAPIKVLLNSIDSLSETTHNISEDLEREIKNYITHKLDLQ